MFSLDCKKLEEIRSPLRVPASAGNWPFSPQLQAGVRLAEQNMAFDCCFLNFLGFFALFLCNYGTRCA